jgi:hypothetical protein
VLILIGVLWAPVMILLSDACVAAGVGQIMAVAMMDLTWPPGNIVGSAGGAAIAQTAGQRLAYAAMAAALLAGFLVLSRRREAEDQAPASAALRADAGSGVLLEGAAQPFAQKRMSGRSLE